MEQQHVSESESLASRRLLMATLSVTLATIPILGNLHQMPINQPHIQLQKWAQEYGCVVMAS
jgi:hypothetical protein